MSNREGEWQYRWGAGFAEEFGNYGHGPAGVDTVVDEKDGSVGDSRGDVLGHAEGVPEFAEPLGAVAMLAYRAIAIPAFDVAEQG